MSVHSDFDFNFKFGHPSTAFGEIHDISYRERMARVTRTQGKAVKLFYTHGLQVVGVPQELLRILGPNAIGKANGIRTISSAHFETPQGFYLLRIENLTRMALPSL